MVHVRKSASAVQHSPLSMDGLFVFLDSDIDEDDLKTLKKKIKKVQRRKLSRKNGQADSSSTSSDTPLAASPEVVVAEGGGILNGHAENGRVLEEDDEPKLRKKKRKLGDDSVKLRAKKRRLKNGNNVDGSSYGRTCRDTTRTKSGWGNEGILSVSNDYITSCVSDSDDKLGGGLISNGDQRGIAKSSASKKTGKVESDQCISKHQLKLKKDSQSSVNGIPVSRNHTHCSTVNGLTNGSISRTTPCLTRCQSCALYKLPVITEEDHREMVSYVALDCEFVGIGPKKTSALGRCSIVDYTGAILFDRFVKPEEQVTDFRTPWSGLRAKDIRRGIPFVAAQEQISAVIKDKVVVGHAVHNDFRVMGIPHPPHLVRDTASCKQLRQMAELSHGSCALRRLTQILLGRRIQDGEHCSVTDARASLDLFRLVRSSWEPVLRAKLERRQARLRVDTGRCSDDPELNSFLEDHYWPPDLFVD